MLPDEQSVSVGLVRVIDDGTSSGLVLLETNLIKQSLAKFCVDEMIEAAFALS